MLVNGVQPRRRSVSVVYAGLDRLTRQLAPYVQGSTQCKKFRSPAVVGLLFYLYCEGCIEHAVAQHPMQLSNLRFGTS